MAGASRTRDGVCDADERPPVWIGHVALGVPDPAASGAFLERLGMRPVERGDGIAILELRGGTHLLLLRSDAAPEPGTAAPFDLMVDDLEASRDELEARGLAPSAVQRSPFHHFFTVTEPGGHEITVNSSHVVGPA